MAGNHLRRNTDVDSVNKEKIYALHDRFYSRESSDLSLSLTFEPCPIWRCFGQKPLNLHSKNPHYIAGDLEKVIAAIKLKFFDGLAEGPKQAVIVVHANGHGTERYRKLLEQDLLELGFAVNVVKFSELT